MKKRFRYGVCIHPEKIQQMDEKNLEYYAYCVKKCQSHAKAEQLVLKAYLKNMTEGLDEGESVGGIVKRDGKLVFTEEALEDINELAFELLKHWQIHDGVIYHNFKWARDKLDMENAEEIKYYGENKES